MAASQSSQVSTAQHQEYVRIVKNYSVELGFDAAFLVAAVACILVVSLRSRKRGYHNCTWIILLIGAMLGFCISRIFDVAYNAQIIDYYKSTSAYRYTRYPSTSKYSAVALLIMTSFSTFFLLLLDFFALGLFLKAFVPGRSKGKRNFAMTTYALLVSVGLAYLAVLLWTQALQYIAKPATLRGSARSYAIKMRQAEHALTVNTGMHVAYEILGFLYTTWVLLAASASEKRQDNGSRTVFCLAAILVFMDLVWILKFIPDVMTLIGGALTGLGSLSFRVGFHVATAFCYVAMLYGLALLTFVKPVEYVQQVSGVDDREATGTTEATEMQ